MTIRNLVLVNTLAFGLALAPLARAEENAAAPAQEAKVEKKGDCEGDCDCSKCKHGKHKKCKKCKMKHKEEHKEGAKEEHSEKTM